MTTSDYRRTSKWSRGMVCGVVFVAGMNLIACAGDPPKSPQTTPQAVRGNAERTFEKLKQEERERGAENQGVPR